MQKSKFKFRYIKNKLSGFLTGLVVVLSLTFSYAAWLLQSIELCNDSEGVFRVICKPNTIETAVVLVAAVMSIVYLYLKSNQVFKFAENINLLAKDSGGYKTLRRELNRIFIKDSILMGEKDSEFFYCDMMREIRDNAGNVKTIYSTTVQSVTDRMRKSVYFRDLMGALAEGVGGHKGLDRKIEYRHFVQIQGDVPDDQMKEVLADYFSLPGPDGRINCDLRDFIKNKVDVRVYLCTAKTYIPFSNFTLFSFVESKESYGRLFIGWYADSFLYNDPKHVVEASRYMKCSDDAVIEYHVKYFESLTKLPNLVVVDSDTCIDNSSNPTLFDPDKYMSNQGNKYSCTFARLVDYEKISCKISEVLKGVFDEGNNKKIIFIDLASGDGSLVYEMIKSKKFIDVIHSYLLVELSVEQLHYSKFKIQSLIESDDECHLGDVYYRLGDIFDLSNNTVSDMDLTEDDLSVVYHLGYNFINTVKPCRLEELFHSVSKLFDEKNNVYFLLELWNQEEYTNTYRIDESVDDRKVIKSQTNVGGYKIDFATIPLEKVKNHYTEIIGVITFPEINYDALVRLYIYNDSYIENKYSKYWEHRRETEYSRSVGELLYDEDAEKVELGRKKLHKLLLLKRKKSRLA